MSQRRQRRTAILLAVCVIATPLLTIASRI